MPDSSKSSELRISASLLRAHPWHGVHIGDHAPDVLTVYIELTPTDTVKYELDKETGLLIVDRPQLYSNVCPTLYGLIPQTYSGDLSAQLCMERTGRTGIRGDGDPLDICILSEKSIRKSNILLRAVPIGGFRMIDGNEADDKIIAVMYKDLAHGDNMDIKDCKPATIERLRHYFLTYKQAPDARERICEIDHIYGRAEAVEVIQRAREDYRVKFGEIEDALDAARTRTD
ncbi:MAG: inorganic pyrophosphatase [Candidatus Hydrogenedentota bacterium]